MQDRNDGTGHDGTVTGSNGHQYPSNYAPQGKDSDLDRIWEILDTIKPGVIPLDARSFLAGQLTGMLYGKYRRK